MKRFVRSLGFVIPLAIAVLVFFVPQVQAVTVDGSLTGDGYGAALAIQGNPTGFGDSTIGTAQISHSAIQHNSSSWNHGVIRAASHSSQ